MTFKKLKPLLLSELPAAFNIQVFHKTLGEINSESPVSEETYKKAKELLRKVKTKEHDQRIPSLYTIRQEITAEDILASYCTPGDNQFFSHLSALYLNGLTNQRPTKHYITTETASRDLNSDRSYNHALLLQSFRKPARMTKKKFVYQKNEFYFLEKHHTGKIGLTQRTIGGIQNRIQVSSIERTLIDTVISPHYSGGIVNVISCFTEAQINISKLKRVYDSYQLLYPYWQSIGLILEKTQSPLTTKKWDDMFSQTKKVQFFLDRQYRPDWETNTSWMVSHPKGLF